MLLDLKPQRLIRTLSTQHWLATMKEMLRTNTLVLEAGESGAWTFWIVRANNNTHDITKLTKYNGKLMYEELDSLDSLE
jgi:hypothetical protein